MLLCIDKLLFVLHAVAFVGISDDLLTINHIEGVPTFDLCVFCIFSERTIELGLIDQPDTAQGVTTHDTTLIIYITYALMLLHVRRFRL